MDIQVIPSIDGSEISLTQEIYLTPELTYTVQITLTPSSWTTLIKEIEDAIKHPERGASKPYMIKGTELKNITPPTMN